MTQKTITIFLFMFVLLSMLVFAFSITDTFPGINLNSTYYTNRSSYFNGKLNVTDGKVNFYGNDTGASGVQRNQGVSFSTKNLINITENGELIFTLQYGSGDVNSRFWAGLVPIGFTSCTGGISIEKDPDVWKLTNGNGCAVVGTDYKAMDTDPHIVRIVVIRDNGINTIFNVYWDGTLWGTVTQVGIVQALYGNFSKCSQSPSLDFYTIDNLYFTNSVTNETVGSLSEGVWCEKNSDCVSQNCEYHKCSLKAGNKACAANAECQSGVCANGHCSAVDFITQIDYAKDQLFGSSENTSNFISLVLIFGVGLFILAGGAGIMAVIWVALSSIFMALIGWLSPFFVIGLIMIGLIILVLGVVVGSKG